MKTVLITGMTASQIKTHDRTGSVTLAGAMREALEATGKYKVDVKPYSVLFGEREDYLGYDKLFLGLGPLKGLGTAYMYQAIQALVEYGKKSEANNVALYCDDTATVKIGREFKTVTKRPHDYVKPFFMYKREWGLVQPGFPNYEQHLECIKTLAGYGDESYWPVFIPSWTYDHAYAAAARICSQAANHVVSFNPSSHFERETLKTHIRVSEGEKYWATVCDVDSPAINRMGVESWNVERVKIGSDAFVEASGFLVPASVWTPDLQIAASIGLPVATDWRALGPLLGEPFEALPANVETMTDDERVDLAKRQSESLARHTISSTVEVLSNWVDS